MHTLKIRKIGSSYGAIFPKEVLNQLQVREGDAVYVVKDNANTLRITSHSPAFAKQMRAFERGCKRYKDALRELSKK